jgi:hypothetical protein
VHTQIASQLKGAKLELKELNARSLLLGACFECPKLKLELDARSLKVKTHETKLLEKPCVLVTSPPCEVCGTLKGKLFHATKENTELKQEVAYLTSHLERTVVSEKMIDDDLNHVEESATKSTYKLGVSFESCEDKGEKSAPKFVPRSNYHKEEETVKSTKTHYPSNPKPSFNAKREVRKETPKPREEAFTCLFFGRADQLDEFCFCRKRYRRDALIMLETHIIMSLLIFRLVLLLVLRLISFIDLTIAHMIFVHERITLCLDALVTAHVPIVVIVPRIGTVLLLEGLTLDLRKDTWMVHIFPVVGHIPLAQMVRCKRL